MHLKSNYDFSFSENMVMLTMVKKMINKSLHLCAEISKNQYVFCKKGKLKGNRGVIFFE